MKKVRFSYDEQHNTLYIDASEKDFYPKYLYYLLEYLEVPRDVKKVFLEDIKNGKNKTD
jgi:hypothetical protein